MEICLFRSTARRIAVLAHPAPVVEVALDPVLPPAVRLAVQVAPRLVPETEGENAVVARALMHRGDTRTKRRRGIKRGREKKIGTETERGIARRRRKRGAILFPRNLNPKDARGTILFVTNSFVVIFW